MDQLTPKLAALHEDYAERVNLAIAEDRDDLVEALAAEFTEVCLHLLQTAAPPDLPHAA